MIDKLKSLTIVIVILFIIFLVGCNRNNPTGVPFDATPTPYPELRAEITLLDHAVPATGVLINIISPGSVTTTGTTDANGYSKITIYGYGNHRIIIPNDTAHGFTAPLEYSLNATTNNTVKLIDRGTQTISMSLNPLYANAFGVGSTIIKYTVSYNTEVTKKYTLTTHGLPAAADWEFDPPFVENDGDTSTLTITTPKYLKIGKFNTSITFTATADDGSISNFPVGDTTNGYALYQNWGFDFVGVSITDKINFAYGSNELQRTLQLSNLTNFPLNYPLKVNVVPGSAKFLKTGTEFDLILGCAAHTGNTYIGSSPSAVGPHTTPLIIPNVYNNLVLNGSKFALQLPCPVASPTWVHMQLQFTNDDGFNYILDCGTNY